MSAHSADWRRIVEGLALVAGRVAADSRLAGRLASAATKGGAAAKPKASAASTPSPTPPDSSAAVLSAAQAVLREAQQRLSEAWTAAERLQKPAQEAAAEAISMSTSTGGLLAERRRPLWAPASAPVPLSSASASLPAASGRSLTFSSLPSGIGSSSYYALSTPPPRARDPEAEGEGAGSPAPFASTERRVPSSALGRALGFARLGVSMVAGAAVDRLSAAMSGSAGGGGGGSGSSSPSSRGPRSSPPAPHQLVSEASAERLAAALCRMRGAALKLGQMLSIQDDALLPPALASALARARAGADIMPRSQLRAAMSSELGPRWRGEEGGEGGLFVEFEDRPMAAASIGQVHRATVVLEEEEEEGEEREASEAEGGNEAGKGGADGEETKVKGASKKETMAVAVKVQYPGVADSVVADVDNLLRVASLTGELFLLSFRFV